MSTISAFRFTTEQLFSDLEKDELAIDAETINRAKKGEGDEMVDIGYEYHIKKGQYDKAMAWYQLAIRKNNPWAQNNIGALYTNGLGVLQNYLLALQWYLEAAIQNVEVVCGNIGIFFEYSLGVPNDKYMALQWYIKSGNKENKVKELNEQKIQLTQQDKDKSIEQLIVETEDIAWPEKRYSRENKLKEEINTLKQLKTKMEEESRAKDAKLKSLEENIQKNLLEAEKKQQEIEALFKAKYKREDELKQEIGTLQQSKIKVEKELVVKVRLLEEEKKTSRLVADKTLNELKARMDDEYTADIKTFEDEKQQEIENPVAQINKRDDKLMEKNKIIQQLKAKTEEESSTKIKTLEEETNTCRYSMECQQKEMNDQRETVAKMSSEIQSLKTMNINQKMQLELQNSSLKTFEKVIASLCSVFEKSFEDKTKTLAELEKSIQDLEQEHCLRDKDIMQLKQNMKALLNKDKKEKLDLELW